MCYLYKVIYTTFEETLKPVYSTRLYHKLVLLLFPAVIVSGFPARSQYKYDEAMDSLETAFEEKRMPDTVYLDAADKMAEQGYGKDNFYTSLQGFRRVAFADGRPSRYKINYYRHLTIDAALKNQVGRSIYWVEKAGEESKKLNPKNNTGLATASYLTGTYSYYKSYDKCLVEYHRTLPILEDLAGKIIFDSIAFDAPENALKVIAFALPAMNDVGTDTLMQQAEDLATRIFNATKSKGEPFSTNLPRSQYFYYTVQFLYNRYQYPDNHALAIEQLELMHKLLLSAEYKAVSPYKEAYMFSDFYSSISQYYLEIGDADSAEHYLLLNNALGLDTSVTHQKYYYESMAWISELKGDQAAALSFLKKANETGDTYITQVLADQNNNLYAQALAEDQKAQMDILAARKRISERRWWIISGSIVVLSIAAVLMIVFLKQRQKRKFLEFKLNIARNLHDEAAPTVLYTKTLVNKIRSEATEQLESEVNHMIEVIRSISHDLKSETQHTVDSLSVEIEQILKKLADPIGFTFNVRESVSKSAFLSHYQYAHLKAILQELISNSIKHAEFDVIDISFSQQAQQLHISYKDNGKGWMPGLEVQGIGLQNMQERMDKLRGKMEISNRFPDGYYIRLSVNLLKIR